MTAYALQATASSEAAKSPFPRHVIPAIIVIYACLLPRELTINLGGIAFQPFRLALLCMLPLSVMQGIRLQIRPSLIDFLVIFAAIWAMIALSITDWVISALNTGLGEGLNLVLAYIAGRACIQSGRDVKAIIRAVLPGLVICSLVMMAESFSHTLLVRPPLGKLLNFYSDYFYEERFGLMRATGPFPHPILAGVFLSSFLPLVWYLLDRPAERLLGLLGVSGFAFTLSSTGFLGFIVGLGLIIANFVQRITRLPIFLMIAVAGLVGMVAVSLISEGGLFSFIVRRLTLSSDTGYYRMAIWENAGAEVLAHPIFGIGTRDYARPAWMVSSSVDAHWLLIAMRYGFPYLIAVFSVMLAGVIFALRGRYSPDPVDQHAGNAIAYSLAAIMFTGLSVYLWEGVDAWMMLLTGMAISFGQYANRWRYYAQTQAAYSPSHPVPSLS